MKKSPLKRRKGIRKVSPKQSAKDAVWRAITDQKCKDEGYICQWCGRTGQRDNPKRQYYYLVGHHIEPRRHGRIDTPENCYITHWLPCHQFIGDNNIDVLQYPTLEAWSTFVSKTIQREIGGNMEYREVTMRERKELMKRGVFDINGNIPAHPGYTGIHKIDGSYYFKGELISDPSIIYAIEHRNDER